MQTQTIGVKPLVFVSTDAHTIAPPDTFRPYIEKRFSSYFEEYVLENAEFVEMAKVICTFPDDVLAVIDPDNAIRSDGASGAWDVARRMKEMDREGVAAELLIYGTQAAITPFFGHSNNRYPAEVRQAGVRAYHRWVADCISDSNGRLFAIADPGPSLDMVETLEDMEWAANHGFRSISVPGIVPDSALPPLFDPYYEPFWHKCVELGLVLSVHAGHAKPQGEHMKFMRQMTSGLESQQEILGGITRGEKKGSFFEPELTPRRIMWSLMLNGAFDRHPDLQLALTEVRADWVPATLAFLDSRFEEGDTPMNRRPSEYWHEHCWAGVSSIKLSEVRLREQIGVDRMMFGRDYPHPEGTWPNTLDWLRDSLGGFAEHELRKILGENAIRCYGLDPIKMENLAQRVGYGPSEILGQSPVDSRLIDHFDRRGGYRKSYESIDAAAVAKAFQVDLVTSVSGR